MSELAFKKGVKRLGVLSIGAGLLGGLFWYVFWSSAFNDKTGALIYAIVVGVLMAVVTMSRYRSQFRKVYRRPGQRLAFEDRTITLDERALRLEYESGMYSVMPWKAILKSEWTKNLLLLFLTDSQYVIIPRRIMDAEIEAKVKERLAEGQKERAAALPKAPVI